jgi:hypothetical protein
LFDSLVELIILYGSEVLEFWISTNHEKIHLKFCKRILNLRLTTPNYMVYGELGRYPLEISVKLRMVSFWTKLVQSENKLSSNLYRLMLQIHDFKFCVMSILIITWSLYSTVVHRCWKLISWWILLDLQICIWIWEILI